MLRIITGGAARSCILRTITPDMVILRSIMKGVARLRKQAILMIITQSMKRLRNITEDGLKNCVQAMADPRTINRAHPFLSLIHI